MARHYRTSVCGQKSDGDGIAAKQLIDEVKQKTSQQAIKVYRHITVETDFSIHLHNDSNSTDIGGSPLGQRLVYALREYGLVNHSVWIEKH